MDYNIRLWCDFEAGGGGLPKNGKTIIHSLHVWYQSLLLVHGSRGHNTVEFYGFIRVFIFVMQLPPIQRGGLVVLE